MAFKLAGMADALRKHGLTVVEYAGWKTRGYAGQDLTDIRGVMVHHTATNRAAFNASVAPTATMCINGRSDLPGPLSQILFARDGSVHLLAAGLANHAGPGYVPGVPRDAGNWHFIGIECESSGIAPADWTADQLRVLPYLCAALELEYLQHRRPEQRYLVGHKEYSSGGKIDPFGLPRDMDGLRADVNDIIDAKKTLTKRLESEKKPAPPVTRGELNAKTINDPIGDRKAGLHEILSFRFKKYEKGLDRIAALEKRVSALEKENDK